MSERLPRLVPPFTDPRSREVHDAILGGPRASGPQAFSIEATDGSLRGPFGLMLHAPHLGLPLQALGSAVRYETSLTARARELAILRVAALTDSAFERFAHELVGAAVGLDDAELAAVASGTFASREGVDAGEAAVVDLVDRLVARDPLDDVAYAAAVDALGEPVLLELVVLVGYYVTLAQLLAVFRVGAPEGEA
ncbi:carboxymuconolactone decarboxylase family protein [Oryzobacter telluris]|uniref:carboxymuconolactone decarboxylase family protein n=1 Tax=Oryzobacter telluris TaxID=3149179 RepID=UPI00370D93D2